MREALRDLVPSVTVHVAVDGDEALSFLRRQAHFSDAPKPNLVFLDFNLPKTDSRTVLRQIKGDELLRSIPIAVLTSSDAERDIRDAYELHANCYVRKPVDLDSFFHAIRTTASFWLDVAHTPV